MPYFGCKITPGNVQDVVFSVPELAELVDSFALALRGRARDQAARDRLRARPGARAAGDDRGDSATRRLERLAELNQDYREASRFMPAEAIPTIEWHPTATGPFAGDDIRLKRHYVRRAT